MKELLPGSTGGWMAMIALAWALAALSLGFGDPQAWRDVALAALGAHALRRGLEGFRGGEA